MCFVEFRLKEYPFVPILDFILPQSEDFPFHFVEHQACEDFPHQSLEQEAGGCQLGEGVPTFLPNFGPGRAAHAAQAGPRAVPPPNPPQNPKKKPYMNWPGPRAPPRLGRRRPGIFIFPGFFWNSWAPGPQPARRGPLSGPGAKKKFFFFKFRARSNFRLWPSPKRIQSLM